jgi:putative tryptophan/tyrosine transport system substrate-binding protein
MPIRIKRRETLAILAGAATATWSSATAAQQKQPMPVVGWLSSRSEPESAAVLAAFHKGLGEAGFVEGQTVAIIYRWADGRYELLPALVAELIDRKVGVVFAAGGPPTAAAAKAATTSIPIVFIANSPVELGLVASLGRPGGNLTGIGLLTPDLVAKQLQYLKEAVPQAKEFAYLENPKSPAAPITEASVRDAARYLEIKVHVLYASTETELEKAFETFAALGAGGIAVHGEPFFDSQRSRIIALSGRHSVVGCYPWREYAVLGGLMSYGSNLPDAYRQAAIYVGRILKGEKPTDLPVQQPTKFEMVVNLKTAKVLRLTIPPSILLRADEVIE